MVEIEEGETDVKASKWLLTCRPTTNTINTKNTFIFDGQERLVIHLDLYCLQPYRIPYSIIYSSTIHNLQILYIKPYQTTYCTKRDIYIYTIVYL